MFWAFHVESESRSELREQCFKLCPSWPNCLSNICGIHKQFLFCFSTGLWITDNHLLYGFIMLVMLMSTSLKTLVSLSGQSEAWNVQLSQSEARKLSLDILKTSRPGPKNFHHSACVHVTCQHMLHVLRPLIGQYAHVKPSHWPIVPGSNQDIDLTIWPLPQWFAAKIIIKSLFSDMWRWECSHTL